MTQDNQSGGGQGTFAQGEALATGAAEGSTPAPPTPPGPRVPPGMGQAQTAPTKAATTLPSGAARPGGPGIVGGTAGSLPHHRDDRQRLTRAGMEAVLAEGGSVLMSGRKEPITSVHELPTEAELAGDDPAAIDAATTRLDERQAQLDAERAMLTRKEKRREARQGEQPPKLTGGEAPRPPGPGPSAPNRPPQAGGGAGGRR